MQFTEAQLDVAFDWLCHRRRKFSDHSDVWHLRFHWESRKAELLRQLQNRDYRFSPLLLVRKANGEVIHLWSAEDALVLKALSLRLAEVLPISLACTHVKGHGGLKSTVQRVYDHQPGYRFILRTDVKGYYEAIDHFLLMEQLAAYIKDRFIMNLLWQYLRRTVELGGLYREIQRGISRGCPLSPLIGAFFLSRLDRQFRESGLFYVRYMDDILILTPTRWKLRRAVSRLNKIFTALKVEKHPNKTFIGRISKGFDFLGYHFSRQPLRLATETVRHFVVRVHRLYEQQQTAPEGAACLGDYVTRWLRWTQAGLRELDCSGLLLPISATETQNSEAQADQGKARRFRDRR